MEAPRPQSIAPNGRPRQVELAARGIRKSFGEQEVLRGIDLEVYAGDLVGIVGASGCGKTVFLNILAGLMWPDSGSVLVADHRNLPVEDAPAADHGAGNGTAPAAPRPLLDLGTLDDEGLDGVRLHWAMVFQKNALFSGTVEENIALWLREHTHLSESQVAERARRSIEAVALDVDSTLPKDRAQLSGGMAKRVAIARAIAVDPLVMFYDEPTTGLDPVVSGHIHELIWTTHHRPRADGVPRTTIIVTHDRDLLRRLHPRVVMLDRGEICFQGTYDDFTCSEVAPAKAYLAAMPVLHNRPPQH